MTKLVLIFTDLFRDTMVVSYYIARDGKWVLKDEFESITKSAAVT